MHYAEKNSGFFYTYRETFRVENLHRQRMATPLLIGSAMGPEHGVNDPDVNIQKHVFLTRQTKKLGLQEWFWSRIRKKSGKV